MAINNATLFEELQSSLEAERRAQGGVTRAAWRDFIHQEDSWGYKYANQKIIPAGSEWPPDMRSALEEHNLVHTQSDRPALAIPISISGEVIGVIRATKDQDLSDWSEDEIDLMKILTSRIADALESARLFQATQHQAAQEQLTSEISSQLRQTLDIETVLKTAAKQLGDAFNAKEVVIRMAPDEPR
jgi:K+-sensing histidine kinase KdpD